MLGGWGGVEHREDQASPGRSKEQMGWGLGRAAC